MSSETSSSYPAIPGYRIERVLGEGGMATVYLAIQENFEREVALKVMSTSLTNDPSFSERFLREARIVAKLMHPHIVTVYDVGVHEGLHYLAMQHIPGDELKDVCRTMPLSRALEVIKDVAQALHFAAGKGYVHRDVKPENIMIHGETGRAVLMDFGIARAVDSISSNVTRTGTIIGTPQYMSPEQAKGEAVGHAGDLYSLGIVLYLVLCGRVPFTADSGMAVGIKHITETPAPLPKGLDAFQPIINKLLAKNPIKRYTTGNDLVAALNAIGPEDVTAADAIRRDANNNVVMASASANTVVSSADTEITGASQSALDDSDTEVDNGTEMIFRPDKLKKPGEKTNLESESALVPHIPEEDRRPIQDLEGEKKGSGLKKLIALCVVAGVGYYSWENQKELGLEPTFTRLAEESQPLLQNLGVADAGHTASLDVEKVVAGTIPKELESDLEGSLAGNEQSINAGSDELETEVSTSTENETTVVDDLLAQVTAEDPIIQLENTANTDPLAIPALVEAYRQKLVSEPKNAEQLTAAIDERQSQLLNAVEESLLAKNWIESQRRYDALLEAFPGFTEQLAVSQSAEQSSEFSEQEHIENESEAAEQLQVQARDQDQKISRFDRIAEAVAKGEKIQSLLAEAEKYFSVNALAVPAGANAMESYQAVLALQADNTQAQNGLNEIAKRYEELMAKAISGKQWKKANRYYERGLLANPDSQALQELQSRQKTEKKKYDAQVAAEKKRQADIAALLQQAEAFLAEGFLIPSLAEKNAGVVSAWQAYRGVLKLDANHKAAKAGLQDINDKVFSRINQLMAVEDTLSQANSYLQQAQGVLTGAAAQSSLERMGEELAAKIFEASKPKVLRVQVSVEPLEVLSDVENRALAADRVIYIGFEFKNFEQDTTVLQAILYDGSGSVKIAQVPVITQGITGQQFFDISRPVEGFANGGYTVELLKGVKVLASTTFLVEK